VDETTSNNNFGPQFHKTFKTQTSKAWARIKRELKEREEETNQPTSQKSTGSPKSVSRKWDIILLKDKKRAHILGLK
jgi:hypothetical protein